MTKKDLLSSLPIQISRSLVLRRSNKRDSEPLAEFNARIHGEDPQDALRVGHWTRDLLNETHPFHNPDDFTLVVEKSSGKIVSAMNLISQVWSYAGIPIKVGRPELVGTDPAYRRRGLVRRQFEVIHALSHSRGEVLQGITGIPHYYRQFGYEMTAELDVHWIGYEPTLPALKKDETETYRIRPARLADMDFISKTYELSTRRLLLRCVRDAAWWKYELEGKHSESVARLELFIIEEQSGKKIGFFALQAWLENGRSACHWLALQPQQDYSSVTPTVLRFMSKYGQELAAQTGAKYSGFELALSSDHPAALALRERLPNIAPPYGWYLRVPDMVAFLKIISPVLENNLAESNCSGFTGKLLIGDYLNVLVLTFAKGKITAMSSRPQVDWKDCDVAFPGLTFYHLVFGYRSLADLQYAFVDCRVEKTAKRALVEALFPVKTSHVFPIQ